MTDLAEFLLARIADDEDAARRAAFGYGAGWTSVTDDVDDWSAVHADGKRDMVGCEDRDVTRHIARHDPARVLAECEVKRRIVEWHKSWPVLVEQQPEFVGPAAGVNDMTFRMTQQIAWLTQEEYRKRFGDEPPTAPMLRILALPYADHPDYREEWRL